MPHLAALSVTTHSSISVLQYGSERSLGKFFIRSVDERQTTFFQADHPSTEMEDQSFISEADLHRFSMLNKNIEFKRAQQRSMLKAKFQAWQQKLPRFPLKSWDVLFFSFLSLVFAWRISFKRLEVKSFDDSNMIYCGGKPARRRIFTFINMSSLVLCILRRCSISLFFFALSCTKLCSRVFSFSLSLFLGTYIFTCMQSKMILRNRRIY